MHMAFSGKPAMDLFMTVNPSVGTDVRTCSNNLEAGLAYCRTPWIAYKCYAASQLYYIPSILRMYLKGRNLN